MKTCDQCHMQSDTVIPCHSVNGETLLHLCHVCIVGSDYCVCCGVFSTGRQEFDWGNTCGFCPECWEDLQASRLEHAKQSQRIKEEKTEWVDTLLASIKTEEEL